MKETSKNILIIILIGLLIIASMFIYILLNKKETSNKNITELTGTVIIAAKDYIILEENNEDYLISNIKGAYSIGDKIKVTYDSKDLDSNTNPKTLKIKDEELIEKNTNEEVKAPNNNENSSSNEIPNNSSSNNETNNTNQVTTTPNKPNNTTNNIPSGNNTQTPNTSSKEETADTAVLNYFNDLNNDFNASSIKDSVKNGFITIVDFLFYNGRIKGHTFSELSDSAKLKVLSMALYFDSKIDKYFPGYKESISNTTSKIYTNIKEKIVTSYLTLTTTICSNNSELCASAKSGFNELKTNFGLTWNLIKDIAGDGLTSLKNWYEIWSGK